MTRKEAKKPRVITRCVANNYTLPDERIIEISFPDGSGCLISLKCKTEDAGDNVVVVYQVDENINAVALSKGK
jgi:hypothetical protein